MEAAHARIGDLIVIEGHRVGQQRRVGEIVEILGAGSREHYRVLWENGRESIFTPGSDAVIRHVDHPTVGQSSSARSNDRVRGRKG